jgi:hypothetical protein
MGGQEEQKQECWVVKMSNTTLCPVYETSPTMALTRALGDLQFANRRPKRFNLTDEFLAALEGELIETAYAGQGGVHTPPPEPGLALVFRGVKCYTHALRTELVAYE